MAQDYPEFIYKYRPIENVNDLKNDYYLDALLNNYCIFSSRRNFNDLFDSKIDFITPTAREIKDVAQQLPKANKMQLLNHINKGQLTAEGKIFYEGIVKNINEKIDSYAFMSLTDIPDSNLMWSHYAKSHYGFCIEYKTNNVPARKVIYKKDIPSLRLIDVCKTFYKLPTDFDIGVATLDALHSKLIEWKYESEYRYLAAQRLGSVQIGEKFTKISYSNDFVESIIFGYRMDNKIKKYIIQNMPANTKFKQATIGRNSMRIVDYKP